MIICKRPDPWDDHEQQQHQQQQQQQQYNNRSAGDRRDEGKGEGGKRGEEGGEEILACGQTDQAKVVQEVSADLKRVQKSNLDHLDSDKE